MRQETVQVNHHNGDAETVHLGNNASILEQRHCARAAWWVTRGWRFKVIDKKLSNGKSNDVFLFLARALSKGKDPVTKVLQRGRHAGTLAAHHLGTADLRWCIAGVES